ncbi:hypothetical protein [Lusitaniella coriacea]|uniref:hypothetical protein n=1 Tax=Lusitaniella coriacea TaxID=1983105 RepID=UPI003CEFC39C
MTLANSTKKIWVVMLATFITAIIAAWCIAKAANQIVAIAQTQYFNPPTQTPELVTAIVKPQLSLTHHKIQDAIEQWRQEQQELNNNFRSIEQAWEFLKIDDFATAKQHVERLKTSYAPWKERQQLLLSAIDERRVEQEWETLYDRAMGQLQRKPLLELSSCR